jgi:G:T/U-mismatch repair DNA glycosylase
VRTALHFEREKAREEGRPEPSTEGVLAIAEALVSKVKAAEWRDRAEAAIKAGDDLAMRDLRSLVSGSDAARDEKSRELVVALREMLEHRVEANRVTWANEVTAHLDEGHVVRALRLSSRPPDPAARFSAELATRLRDAASVALSPSTPPDKWLALLQAVVESPVRRTVKPEGFPPNPSPELLETARQQCGRVPALAPLLGLSVPPPPGPARPSALTKPPVRRPARPPKPSRPGGALTPVSPARAAIPVGTAVAPAPATAPADAARPEEARDVPPETGALETGAVSAEFEEAVGEAAAEEAFEEALEEAVAEAAIEEAVEEAVIEAVAEAVGDAVTQAVERTVAELEALEGAIVEAVEEAVVQAVGDAIAEGADKTTTVADAEALEEALVEAVEQAVQETEAVVVEEGSAELEALDEAVREASHELEALEEAVAEEVLAEPATAAAAAAAAEAPPAGADERSESGGK